MSPAYANCSFSKRKHPGFVAALDQSGASTPGSLRLSGEGACSSDEEMFAIVHQMRTGIMTSASFTGERIIGAILFENTMDTEESRDSGKVFAGVCRRADGPTS